MRLILPVLVAILLLSGLAFGQTIDPEVRAGIEARRVQLEAIESLLREDPREADLVALSEEVRRLRQEAALAEAPVARQIDALRAELEALGPPPAEGEPAESEDIQRERRRLNQQLAEAEAARAQIALNIAAAERLAGRIAELRREAFTEDLFARTPFLISPELWTDALRGFQEGYGNAVAAYRGWYDSTSERGRLDVAFGSIIGALVLAIALLVPVRRALNRLIAKRIAGLEPYPSRRVILAAVRTAASVLPGVLGGFFLYEALRLNGAIPEEGEVLARAIWFGFIVLLLADGVASAVFAPRLPAWRVLRLETRSVFVIRGLLLGSAVVIVVDRVLIRGAEVFGGSPALTTVQEGLVSMTLGILLFLLARDRLWSRGEDTGAEAAGPARVIEGEAPPGAPEAPARVVAPAETSREEPRKARTRIRVFVRILAVIAVLAPLVGYTNLGYFIATRTFALFALFGLVWSLRALMREMVRLADRKFSSKALEEAEGDERLLLSWIGIIIDLLALAVFVPPALLILGAAWADVRGWIVDAFIGFEIGNVRISLAKILTAVAIFALLLWLTRQAQKAAETQIFPRSRMDKGVQNSLRTLMGYIGLVIAFAAGVGTLGFDLSNLAIIAGALSVGIGFGLQSIVNNFVSGLILLFERPIKVGDWIITSSGEGIVKRISVRSTEIETFDRSSVIVPNSELISSSVTNWTHKDRIGRIIINVGTAYSSDAKRVIEILEQVARESTDILNYPAPFVVFEDFGASSLDFSLRAYIRDVSESLRVRTRLRVAIHERFREEGIEIPFPQRDINMRDLPEDFFDRAFPPKPGDPA
ncbi:DUF3772 domain-containing protein [Parvularcula lutaonensis]|uniref:DUF3772 domain-containing protein n=1 Tax=Parvularcula lutaonensis TaxID=491923 RepID=A0ABV7MEG5_9PROT|nr:DUF3772 domain-containing protein [Parvularcula lutaonensis]GGY50923.1 mechanosensitive ion channel protein MscS [Parvularcula lutaonensis]